MLCKRCRVLVLWLMALVLPLQGLAAATMLDCTPDNARQHGLATPTVAAADQAARHAAHAAHAAHTTAAPAAATADTAASITADDAASASGHGMLKCCSAVGALAVLQSAPNLTLTPARFAAPVPPPGRPDLGVVPAGIDRPPRASHA